MGSIRKDALIAVMVLALSILLALTAGYLRVRDRYSSDPAIIQVTLETVAQNIDYDIVGARKAGYTDRDIAEYLAAVNKTELKGLWFGSIFPWALRLAAFVLCIVATILVWDAKSTKL